MTDMFGQTVNIGDTVVYTDPKIINGKYFSQRTKLPLTTGVIEKFRANDTEAVIEIKKNVRAYFKSAYILKYNK